MDVILHLGAHRTASTSFQRYMRGAAGALTPMGVGFWGPARTRGGLFAGVHAFPPDARAAARARGRICLRLEGCARRGVSRLIVSDENMIGTPRTNLARGALYPEAGLRMARLGAAFGGRIGGVVLQIRCLDSYWASLWALAMARGAAWPDPLLAARIAFACRGWREVICDLACALPGVPLTVTPFERFAARPDRLLAQMGCAAPPPVPTGGLWINRAPDLAALRRAMASPCQDMLPGGDGRWSPFTAAQAHGLRARYAADLAWLRAGAGGLARFVENIFPEKAPQKGPPGAILRGSKDDDSQERRLARPC